MAQILYLVFIVVAAVAVNGDIPPQDERIVGGVNTTIEEHPYQVSLLSEENHECGGSILNETIILTAAQCVGYLHSIRAGSTLKGEGGQVINVRQQIRHPKYDSSTFDYDVAILILESPLTLDDKVQPVKLPDENEELPEGIQCTITGWGAVSEDGPLSNSLLKVVIPSVSQEVCRKIYLKTGKVITSQMLCAGGHGIEGNNVCHGDGGGPLIALGKLHGIVSWGYGCARPEFPAVFTRVASVREWIRSMTGL